MRVLLAELSPTRGDLPANLARIRSVVAGGLADVAVFPELFLTGYKVGDRIHQLALRPDGPEWAELTAIARAANSTVIVGTPIASADRAGETQNAVVAVGAGGERFVQVKRYLPTYGPFEEGVHFTPAERSEPTTVAQAPVGLMICYDAFFPEVGRELAARGAQLLVAVSAAPVTSRRLFDKVLPARAVENACPVVYVNRVGVEDGLVFGGGTGAWDARGEPLALEELPLEPREREEHLYRTEVDLTDAARWRPFRPVLRDVASRPSPVAG
ncbi:MAG TPA: carbon-nitrogen hydrolase family protein [Thermoplasmata archaeon]|nr:carbon-nitrogen hydrolase family protein [Thermoplasmata archaeon]